LQAPVYAAILLPNLLGSIELTHAGSRRCQPILRDERILTVGVLARPGGVSVWRSVRLSLSGGCRKM